MSDRKQYAVTARKDGRWWLVEVPELDTAGQARNRGEVDEVAREIIGLWLDVAPDTFDVSVTIEVPDDVAALWGGAESLEQRARADAADAAAQRRRAVRALLEQGYSKTDAAAVLGVSSQRISQLVPAGRTAS